MKITSLETFPVPPRWLFLKLSTGEGPAGWGEPAVEGRAGTVAAAVEELSGYLGGTDPFRIEVTFRSCGEPASIATGRCSPAPSRASSSPSGTLRAARASPSASCAGGSPAHVPAPGM